MKIELNGLISRLFLIESNESMKRISYYIELYEI